LPVSNAGADQRICRGSSTGLLALNQNSNNSYKWFTTSGVLISNSFFADVTANTDTLFVLMATDTKGCSTRDTMEVFAIDPPIFSLAGHSCLTNGLVINSNPSSIPANGIFRWFENNNVMLGENNPSALPVGAVGTYIVEYKFGSCAAYDTTIVTIPPQLYSQDTITCAGQTLVIQTTNVSGATYAWTATAPATINGAANTFSANVTATTVANDSTNFVVAVTDNVGCTSHDTVEVKTVPPPNLILTDVMSCVGDTVVLVGKPSNINDALSKYTWFKDGLNQNVPDTTSQLYVATSGNYTLMYGIGGCSANDGAIVTFNPTPELHLADVGHCFDNGSSTQLDAGSGFATYQWFSNAPDSLSVRPDVSEQRFTIYAPGPYNVKVTNTFGCSTSGTIRANSVCRPDLNPPTGFFPSVDPSSVDCNNPPGRCDDLYFRPFGNFKHATNIQFTVFNRWGEIIFFTDDPLQGWDGKYRGQLMETGTYPWTLYYEGVSDEFKGPFKKSGSVTIIK
jgi:gliding motility-associated-like protein